MLPVRASNNPKQPAEEFGIGGVKEWFVEAPPGTGPTADTVITSVNKDANFFDGGGKRYFYDANDTFQIQTPAGGVCTTVSQTAFESALRACLSALTRSCPGRGPDAWVPSLRGRPFLDDAGDVLTLRDSAGGEVAVFSYEDEAD